MMASAGVARRTVISRAWWGLSLACLVAVIGILFFVFAFVLVQGVPALKPQIFFTPTHGIAGGLSNAIEGTLMLVFLGLVMVIVVGLGTAVWTVEFAPPWAKKVIRFMVDVLAGIPSIVVGYFLYVALVEEAGWGFSLIAGSLALAIFMLPYVVRAADVALTNVPSALKEGAVALGARPAMVVSSIN